MKPALVVLALLTVSAAAQPANSCADPYWKDTLRCVFFPNEIPQPNLQEAPRVPGNQPMPAFTRVFLENLDVRCTDGTRPLMYVDKAICTNANGCGGGTRRGDAIESNRWIFTMSGGDSCNGERCAFFYAQGDERGFLGSSTKGPMRDMEGIHDPDPAANPVFAGYNRVRIEKCTFDRYMGRAAETAIEATAPNGTPVAFNAYHHGFFIMQEAFAALEHGLRYTTWRHKAAGETNNRRRACCGDSGSSNVVSAQETLPPLADAEVVLFVGHSNASHGLYHNIDNLAAELANIPGFDADVRALFDENFLPSVENEAAFAATAPPNSDLTAASGRARAAPAARSSRTTASATTPRTTSMPTTPRITPCTTPPASTRTPPTARAGNARTASTSSSTTYPRLSWSGRTSPTRIASTSMRRPATGSAGATPRAIRTVPMRNPASRGSTRPSFACGWKNRSRPC